LIVAAAVAAVAAADADNAATVQLLLLLYSTVRVSSMPNIDGLAMPVLRSLFIS
jgi:hypothetical protein